MARHQTPASEPEAGTLRALCCECGQVRKVSDRYYGRAREADRFYGEGGYLHPGEAPTETTYYRCVMPLKCAHCGRETRHAYLRDFQAYRDQSEERQQAEHRKRAEAERLEREGTPEQQQMYRASLAMLEQAGVRYDERRIGPDADLTIERGGGHSVVFLIVRDDLPMARKLEVIRKAWAKMIPACDPRWIRPDHWNPSRGSKGLEWQGYEWMPHH